MWVVKTMLQTTTLSGRGFVGPNGPIDGRGGFAKVLVHDAAHVVILDRHLEGHSLHLPGTEFLHVAADQLHPAVLGLVAGLEWVVLADVNERVGSLTFLNRFAFHFTP